MTYSAGDSGHVAVHNAIDVTQASVIAAAAASAASAALSASLVGAPADAAVAAIVGDPASDTATLLSSTYARPVQNSVILFGTSLEAQNFTGSDTLDSAGSVALNGRGWFNWCNAFSADQLKLRPQRGGRRGHVHDDPRPDQH